MYTIYLITNKVNNKKYVGITSKSVEVRFAQHLKAAFDRNYPNLLYRAFRKYQKDNFTLTVLETDIPFELGEERERYYIALYNTYYKNHEGYNMTLGGNGTVGYKITPEARKKISLSGLGRVFSEERNQKLRLSKLGVKFSEEHCRHISEARMGKFIGEDNPFYGKHHTEETKQKISNANKGRVRSEEFKKHQSEIRIGKKFTEEHKRKLSKNNGASRVVYQYTLGNVFISEYPSCNEAERRTGVKAYNIRSCCYGKQHTAGGFIWKYK